MMNYQQMETMAFEQHKMRLAEAEQRRFAKLVPSRPHPLLAWVGQQLIGWGQRLQHAEARPVLSVSLARLA